MKIIRTPGTGHRILGDALRDLEKKVAKVGFFESAKYKDGTSVAKVAAIQEFGAPAKHIPPRPFMRPTITEKETEWRSIAERGAKAILTGKETTDSVLEKIGLKAAGDIRKTISHVMTPPLKQGTIDARKSKRANKKTVGSLTKPLVDTGIMINSVTNTVEPK